MKPEGKRKPYYKSYYCTNCESSFAVIFEFGEVASKPACPNCGVSDDQLDRERRLEVPNHQ